MNHTLQENVFISVHLQLFGKNNEHWTNRWSCRKSH